MKRDIGVIYGMHPVVRPAISARCSCYNPTAGITNDTDMQLQPTLAMVAAAQTGKLSFPNPKAAFPKRTCLVSPVNFT